MTGKINFAKVAHRFEANNGNTTQTEEKAVKENFFKKNKKVLIAGGVGATIVLVGRPVGKAIKNLFVGKKSQQEEVQAPEDQQETAPEETAENKKPQGKKADK